MSRFFRIIFGVMCAAGLLLSLAFLIPLPIATSLWPWPATSPLSYLLLASLFATIATAHVWPLFLSDDSSIAGVGLVYAVALPPLALLGISQRAANPGAETFGIICAVVAVIGIGLVVWGWRLPARDARPLPPLIKWSFVAFIVTLILSGAQLILRVPNILPWTVTPELSSLFGWAFIGSVTYFVYALYRPGWSNAGGHLLAFLVYDLILIGPFLLRLPTTPPEHIPGLIIYLIVIVYSGVLAVYFLLINPSTRLIAKRA